MTSKSAMAHGVTNAEHRCGSSKDVQPRSDQVEAGPRVAYTRVIACLIASLTVPQLAVAQS
ncbi:MAG: hypothetical protein V7640_1106, partial [Betaproteobacteria bacterium]